MGIQFWIYYMLAGVGVEAGGLLTAEVHTN